MILKKKGNSLISTILIVLFFSCETSTPSVSVGNKKELISNSSTFKKSILLSIEEDAKHLSIKLQQESFSKQRIKFMIDTFKIAQISRRKMSFMNSTQEMNDLVIEETGKYDSLLNKYFNQLSGKLTKEHQQILIDSQRAWLIFCEKEKNLIGKLCDEKYSGGTIQSNIYIGLKCDLIKNRMIELFEHSCFD